MGEVAGLMGESEGEMAEQPAGEWMTVREASAATGISVGRIYTLINTHQVKAELRRVGTKDASVLVVRACEVTSVEESRRTRQR
jgi:hypothetical protein